MEPIELIAKPDPRKLNRRRAQEAGRDRPVVHGVLPYLGHRPDRKHEQRRIAKMVRTARERG